MLKRLRRTFVLVLLLTVAVLLAGIFGTVIHFTRQNLERESIARLREIAAEPSRVLRTSGPGGSAQPPCFVLQPSLFGDVVAMSNGFFDLSDAELLREILYAAAETGQETALLSEYGLRFLRGGDAIRPVFVFADVSGEQSMLRGLYRTCALIGAGSLLLFFGLAVLLARRAVKPVEEAWNEQKQFVADASHELKTPLTVIMTGAELVAAPDCSPELRSQCAENILTMSRRMRGLIESMLDLARIENGTVAASETLDLSALVEGELLPFEPVFFERGLTLTGELEAGITVTGCPQQLRQLVGILLDNACKYADAPGTVTVRLSRQGRAHCVLSVSDPGAPIPQSELKNLTRRFYRADPARSAAAGYGLGLSIAERITAAHRGRLRAESADGYNTFSVTLPT